jgi:hypothetical protein
MSAAIGDSSSPLIPAKHAQFSAPNTFQSRAMIEGSIDAITGSPLLMETDFSLAFGSAVFRHTRTYAEMPSASWHERELVARNGDSGAMPADSSVMKIASRDNRNLADEMLWDWQGQGWMMGENPVFLFEAGYWGVVSRPLANAQSVQPRCYFIPDAHHAVPFERSATQLIDGRPIYVAPGQFDAMMVVRDGVWDATLGAWTQVPTRADVWLYGRSVRYSISIQADRDVPRLANGTSLHEQPSSATDVREGTPYLGLVDEIADRYGNRIVLEYAT